MPAFNFGMYAFFYVHHICHRKKASLTQALQEQSKKLRHTIYEVDETMKDKFPAKNTEDSLEKELEYCEQLIPVIKENDIICSYPKVEERKRII